MTSTNALTRFFRRARKSSCSTSPTLRRNAASGASYVGCARIAAFSPLGPRDSNTLYWPNGIAPASSGERLVSPYPARSTIAVAALPLGAKVEIEMTALRPPETNLEVTRIG